MTNTTDIKKEVLSIAEYLGCNGGELWSEMSSLIDRAVTEARIDELEWVMKQNGNAFVGNGENQIIWSTRNRIARLSNTTGAKAGVIDETMQG